MRLIFYYMVHAVKNQIRKLFRTWVAVLILVCILVGVIFGVGAAFLSELFEDAETPEDSEITETLPEEGEDISLSPEQVTALVELIAGGIVLVVLTFSVLTADKSGSSIFLMADVNLLFQAPMKPQSVLLFRLIMQTGTSLVLTVYLLFQIPNLMLNLGLNAGAAFAMLGAWFLMLVYSKLVSVLLYTISATHPAFKRRLRPALYLCLALLAGGYLLFAISRGGNYFEAALSFFNAPLTRFIPIWGWLKALVIFGVTGKPLPALAAAAALLLGAVLLVVVIWRIKADFYEDAMARSAETAQIQQAAQGNANPALVGRKKDRSDKLRRDGLNKGNGASVYFYKSMYNRFRFAHLRYFTKTAETDLVVAIGVSLILLYVIGTATFPAVAAVLAIFTFFRALGNPIAADVKQESFFLVPDSAHKKIFFSFLGGVVNSALDLLPAFLVAAILLGANPAEVLLWFLLTVSVGAYADSVGVFIDLSLSTGLANNIRNMVQILFVYFGLIPAAVLLVVGFALELPLLFAGITTLFCAGVAAVFLALSPLFVLNGRK